MGLGDDHAHHLRRVLRLGEGAPVSYTDGAGTVGAGVLAGSVVRRGEERPVPAPRRVTVAVAPPDSKDRQRMLVEKLAELGVERVRWLATRHGEGRPPSPDRSQRWADAALEQSRGAYRTLVDGDLVGLRRLEPPVVVAEPGGRAAPGGTHPITLVVGPEGGWAPGEIPAGWPSMSMGPRVLRVETAAIVGAFALLSASNVV